MLELVPNYCRVKMSADFRSVSCTAEGVYCWSTETTSGSSQDTQQSRDDNRIVPDLLVGAPGIEKLKKMQQPVVRAVRANSLQPEVIIASGLK